MKMKRPYTMGARAQGVAETRRRIQEGFLTLAATRAFTEISLEDIAREAGVSVQTILRQFGSRAGLIEEQIEFAINRVTEERATPVGDVDTAMRVLLDHYEFRGRTALLLLSQEQSDRHVATVTERGRQMHRAWVQSVFSTYADRDDAVTDLLVVATDVYTWKLLRLDRGLSRSRTEQHMKTLVTAVLATIDAKED